VLAMQLRCYQRSYSYAKIGDSDAMNTEKRDDAIVAPPVCCHAIFVRVNTSRSELIASIALPGHSAPSQVSPGTIAWSFHSPTTDIEMKFRHYL